LAQCMHSSFTTSFVNYFASIPSCIITVSFAELIQPIHESFKIHNLLALPTKLQTLEEAFLEDILSH